MEKLAGSLPLHLVLVLMSDDGGEAKFRYLLCGVRLLHSLCDLASRNYKFEQVNISNALFNLYHILLLLWFTCFFVCDNDMLSKC